MDKKTVSIISYITIIGWIVAFIIYKNKQIKSSLEKFHLKQAFGLALLGILNGVASWIITPIVPVVEIVFTVINVAIFVLWILGIINAANGEEKPLPVIGKLFDNPFDFIK